MKRFKQPKDWIPRYIRTYLLPYYCYYYYYYIVVVVVVVVLIVVVVVVVVVIYVPGSILILAVVTGSLRKLQTLSLTCTVSSIVRCNSRYSFLDPYISCMCTSCMYRNVLLWVTTTDTSQGSLATTKMFICFSGGLLPRHSCLRCVRCLERGRYCGWGGVGPERLKRRRQLDRVGGNRPYYCRGGWRRRRRHRHCLDVGR